MSSSVYDYETNWDLVFDHRDWEHFNNLDQEKRDEAEAEHCGRLEHPLVFQKYTEASRKAFNRSKECFPYSSSFILPSFPCRALDIFLDVNGIPHELVRSIDGLLRLSLLIYSDDAHGRKVIDIPLPNGLQDLDDPSFICDSYSLNWRTLLSDPSAPNSPYCYNPETGTLPDRSYEKAVYINGTRLERNMKLNLSGRSSWKDVYLHLAKASGGNYYEPLEPLYVTPGAVLLRFAGFEVWECGPYLTASFCFDDGYMYSESCDYWDNNCLGEPHEQWLYFHHNIPESKMSAHDRELHFRFSNIENCVKKFGLHGYDADLGMSLK